MDSDRLIRYGSALVSSAAAIVYFLIAANVVRISSAKPEPTDWIAPTLAGMAYIAIAVVVVAIPRLIVFAACAVIALLTVVGYLVTGSTRVPPYDVWGFAVSAAQAVLAVALSYLAWHATSSDTRVRK